MESGRGTPRRREALAFDDGLVTPQVHSRGVDITTWYGAAEANAIYETMGDIESGGQTLPAAVRQTRVYTVTVGDDDDDGGDLPGICAARGLGLHTSPPSGPKPSRPPRHASMESTSSASSAVGGRRSSTDATADHGSAAPKKPSSAQGHEGSARGERTALFGGAAKRDRRSLIGSPALVQDLAMMSIAAITVKKRLDFEEPAQPRVNHFYVPTHPRATRRPHNGPAAAAALGQQLPFMEQRQPYDDGDDDCVAADAVQKRHRFETRRR